MKDKRPVKEKPARDEEECAEGEKSPEQGTLKPVRPKIGESKDNLKQRSDWFQKRSGKRS